MKDKSYNDLKKITDNIYSGSVKKWASKVLDILGGNKIKTRQRDGLLYSINLSISKSKGDCILVGLRQVKKDKLFTEDHFLFEINKPIMKFYKGKLEKVFLEYKGVHKKQVV